MHYRYGYSPKGIRLQFELAVVTKGIVLAYTSNIQLVGCILRKHHASRELHPCFDERQSRRMSTCNLINCSLCFIGNKGRDDEEEEKEEEEEGEEKEDKDEDKELAGDFLQLLNIRTGLSSHPYCPSASFI